MFSNHYLKGKGNLCLFIKQKRTASFVLAIVFTLVNVSIGIAQTMYGISGNNLIRFNASTPGNVQQTTQITGMASGQSLSGLDFRPNTGELYTMGYNSTTGQAHLYKLNATTGVATTVGTSSVTLAQNMGRMGFDFDPSTDQIRVTGSNGFNYRMNPTSGTVSNTDPQFAYGNTDVNFGATANLGAMAYSNNFIGSANSKAYGYDNTLNVVTSLDVNAAGGGLSTVGASGFSLNTTDQSSDMDISFDAATQSDKAFFVGKSGTDNASSLYSMNLTTGQATSLGHIGAGNGMAVSHIATSMNPPYSGAVTGQLMWGITMNDQLVSFDSENPDDIRSITSLNGVTAGQKLMGMDVRAADGKMYAMGYDATNGNARLYTLNASTGVATAIGSSAINLGIGLGSIGFDFNPVADRIRVTGSNGSNFRLNPNDGTIAGTDTNLSYASGDVNQGATASIGAVAYTNSYAGTTSTTLYSYDHSLNALTSQSAPNTGSMTTIGNSGIIADISDRSFDMDIFYNQSTQSNNAYFIGNSMGQTGDRLYKVNLTSGAMSTVGSVGLAVPLRTFAMAGNQVQAQGVDLELSISSTTTDYTQYVAVPYTITVKNNGTETANNVTISAGLPNGMVHTSNSATAGNYSLYDEMWNVGTLNAGQSAVLTLNLFPLVTDDSIHNFVQVMSADGNDGDSTPGNDNNQVADEDDEGMLTVYGPGGSGGPSNPSGNSNLKLFANVEQNTYNTYKDVYYHLMVVNQGPDDATGVKVHAGLPQNFVHSSNSATSGNYSLYNQRWELGSLGVGDTAWLDLTLFPLGNAPSVNNFFQVMSSDQTDGNSTPGNGTCCNALEDDEANINITWQANFDGSTPPQSLILGNSSETSSAIVYPSPAASSIRVAMACAYELPKTYVSIVDQTGRAVEIRETDLLKGYNEWTFDVSELNSGIYFVRVPGETQPVKFVKI